MGLLLNIFGDLPAWAVVAAIGVLSIVILAVRLGKSKPIPDWMRFEPRSHGIRRLALVLGLLGILLIVCMVLIFRPIIGD